MVAESLGLVKYCLSSEGHPMATAIFKRAHQFFTDAGAEFGLREGEHLVIPMRQCELAKRRNVAASTIGAYLSALDDHVVRRHPEIVLRLPAPSAVHGAGRGITDIEGASSSPSDLAKLSAALVELCAAQAKVIALLTEDQPKPRELRVSPRGFDQEASDARAHQAVSTKEELLLASSPLDNSARFDAKPRRSLSATDIDAALRPLEELARRRNLKPINNRRMLHQAMQQYSLDELKAGIARVGAMAGRVDSTIRSPFGLLVRAAREGDHELFSTASKGLPSSDISSISSDPEQDTSLDPAADAQVSEFESDPTRYATELRALDEIVDRAHPFLAERGMGPVLRHNLRCAAFTVEGADDAKPVINTPNSRAGAASLSTRPLLPTRTIDRAAQ